MPSYTIDAPNGKSYTIEGENADGALAALKQHLGSDEPKKNATSITDAVTDIPHEIAGAASEALTNLKAPGGRGSQGPIEGLLNTGKAVLGVPQMLMSPITGAARSLIGHPMAQAEHAVGTLIAPEIAAKDDPQKMYETAKRDVDTSLAGVATRGVPAAAVAPVISGPRQEIVSAADRLTASGNKVEVPQAIASDSMVAQRAGQAIRNVPIVGDAIPKATARLTGQLEDATGGVASEFGGGSGPNIAHKIGDTIAGAAEQEGQAAKTAAAQSDAAVLSSWENSLRNTNEAIAGVEQSAAQRARQALGDMSPQDMGETLIARLRQGEQDARANKDRLYGIAGKSDASIESGRVSKLRGDVEQSLNERGDFIDPVLTPAATRMMAELDSFGDKAGRTAQRVNPVAAPAAVDASAGEAAPKSQSLLEFIASKGGLGPDAELGAIGAHGHTVNIEGVGRRKLVRQVGLTLDYAREAAEEAGYLRGDHKGTSSVNDLLNVIDAEMRGQKRYPEGFEGHVPKREAAARSEREQHEYNALTRGLESDLAAAGHGELGATVKQRAVKLMADEKIDADTAVERALRHLDQEDKNIYSGSFPGDHAVTMEALERTRKRLNAMSGAATNDADRRAAKRIISSFDDWLGSAFDNALFSGSDEALKSYRAARAANTEWRQRFGFNARDDADRIVNRIVTGEVTPQEAANYVVGAAKVGAKGVSSRLLTRITEATGGDPDAMNAIRGGVWNRLSQSTEGVTAKSAGKVADDIGEFLSGSGRDVANRLFSEPQRNIMRAYADTIRAGVHAREAAGEIAANTKPGQMEVGVGPFQQLAKAVLGGGRSDEALYSAINSYAKSGSKGDINLLSKVLQAIPQSERGNLAGAIVRDMGVSPRTGQFSPDVFVSSWNTYKPEAKALLFGMSGPQRRALDDIAIISQRMKDVGSKFGNPSGTAQNVNFFALASSAFAAPLTTLAGGIGGAVVAKMLASPAGAVSVSRWSKAYERVASLPNIANQEALKNASSMLAINVSRDTGMPIRDLMKQLQGPVPAAADSKDNRPVGVREAQPN